MLMTSAFARGSPTPAQVAEPSAIFLEDKDMFLLSIALIFSLGFAFSQIAKALRLPPLIGMLAAGIVLGPYALDLIDGSILAISADLRQIALIIIVLRAGLALDVNALRKIGRPALLLCFVPACFEICATVIFAPIFLNVSYVEAAIIGTVVAAVSPAVVIPRMLLMQEKGLGADKGIPQMIMAGASVDDVFVIVLFTAFSSMADGGSASVWSFAGIPLSIVLGAAVGALVGVAFGYACSKIHMRDSLKALLILCFCLFCVAAQQLWGDVVPFSGLLAVMGFGMAFRKKREVVAVRLSSKFSKLWIAAEIMLFVLVGASVDLSYAAKSLGWILLMLVCGLAFRAAGVLCCLIKTKLSVKERLFCVVAYMPKATVQAAIGGVPLAMGLACGHTVLAVAVIAIIFTAPLGALLIDLLIRKGNIFSCVKPSLRVVESEAALQAESGEAAESLSDGEIAPAERETDRPHVTGENERKEF